MSHENGNTVRGGFGATGRALLETTARSDAREMVERHGHDKEALVNAIARMMLGCLRCGVDAYVRECAG
jgi:hypothetical protein